MSTAVRYVVRAIPLKYIYIYTSVSHTSFQWETLIFDLRILATPFATTLASASINYVIILNTY
jgi:hypothetical protein